MNPLEKKLKEIHEKSGQDVFLDEATIAQDLQLHYSIIKKDMEPVLWCVRNLVYFKAYTDKDTEHLWYYRYSLLLEMQAAGFSEADAEEAANAWIGLANLQKKEELKKPDESKETLFVQLYNYEKQLNDGHGADALEGFLELAQQTSLGNYYAGKCALQMDPPNQELAYEQFLAGAEKANRDCEYELARCRQLGIGTEADEAAAIEGFQQAAQVLQPAAMAVLGILFYHGYASVTKNLMRSLYFLSWAARQGNELARSFLAVYYKHESENGQVTNAHPYFTEKTMNMGQAYYRVAQMYDTAEVFIHDAGMAKKYYMNAVRLGSPEAAAVVREQYKEAGVTAEAGKEDELLGQVVSRDARTKLQQTANNGDLRAQYLMGVSYMNGIGFEKNLTVALSWLRRGASAGDEDCKKMLAVCNYHIGETYFHETPARGIKGISYLQKALENPDYLDENMRCDCYTLIGMAYYEAEGDAKDPEKGEEAMRYPLEHGFLRAHLYMAEAWEEGKTGEADMKKALAYYLSADEIDESQARPVLEAAYKRYAEKGALADLPAETQQKLQERGIA